MKPFLNIMLLIMAAAGLFSVVLGVFFLTNPYLIASGCLLAAIGAGIGYANRKRDHHR